MKKSLCLGIIFICSTFLFGAELKAKDIATEAAKKESVDESISYIKEKAGSITDPAEKRSTYIFLASLQEQLSRYEDAQKSYAVAAGIGAADAEGMPKKNNQQLVLDAVRCSLSAGDWQTADNYLNSSVRNAKSETIQAYIKLYTQWSALCKAESVSDLQEPVLMLQTYTKLDNMKAVKPAVYLTLWYVTGEKSYGNEIKKQFPSSVEAAIINGDVQLLPTPFWFFVPKSGEAELGTGSYSSEVTVTPSPAPAKTTTTTSKTSSKIKLQLGLFKTESNAKLLSEEVNKKGFNSYVTAETRASGTTYYLVLVDDDGSNTVADRLRSSGYECYAVE